MERWIFGLEQVRQSDDVTVGKKCANLGELIHAGFRVPPGFALTLDAYSLFTTKTALQRQIDAFFRTFHADPNDLAEMPLFDAAAATIRAMFEHTEVPEKLREAIDAHYESLCRTTGRTDTPVATRSAGPSSHPGQYETYLHVTGGPMVVANVVRVWSSVFNSRSLVARARHGLPLGYDPIGVAVLAMVDAKAAGVMFTVNPTDGDPRRTYVESNWGLGESVVSGEVTPDGFLVDNARNEIVKRSISRKVVHYAVEPATGSPSLQRVPEAKQDAPSLSDDEILELSRIGKLVEAHFGVPQDIEWAVEQERCTPDSVFLLQTRPIKSSVAKRGTTDQIVDIMMRHMSH